MTPRSALAVTLLVMATSACVSTPLSYLAGSGSASSDILQQMSWGFSLVCVAVVIVIILMTTIAVRRSTAAASGSDIHQIDRGGSGVRLIYWGVALSVPVLIALAVWTFIAVKAIAEPTSPPPLTATITAHRWWWEVRYNDRVLPIGGVIGANELVIPTGTPVALRLESADVIHDFWVPKLGPKMDMIPGHPNMTWIEARDRGLYRGQCAEFCGLEHARMGFVVRAVAPADYQRWIAAQRMPAIAPPSDARTLFEVRCSACHTVRGTDSGGILGPDLTHVGSRATLAAAVLPNTPAALDQWLADPQAVKPGALMPQVPLTQLERARLVAWLEALK